MRGGRTVRVLLKSDIEIAQQNTKSARQAADYLNVAYNTYKKHAKLHGIWKTNPKRIGIPKSPHLSRHLILDQQVKEALEGRRPNMNHYMLKYLALKYGYLKEECGSCGYNEQRVTDRKVPLILIHLDGNKSNHKFENLKLLCFCCYHNQIGDITELRKQEFTYKKDW